MRAIVQSHLPAFSPSKGVHYCGRGFVLPKLAAHKVHSGGHVLEKAVVPFTQVVKAGLSIRGTYEAVLGTFPIAGQRTAGKGYSLSAVPSKDLISSVINF